MNFIKNLKAEFYPLRFRCILCGVEIFGGELCPDCAKDYALNSGATCPVCGRRTAKNEICLECKAHAPVCAKIASPIVYGGSGAALIARFKTGQRWLGEYLAPLMAEKLSVLPEFDVITYVPMTEKGVKMRGYNQAALLAAGIAEICGKECAPLIAKIKDTPPQKGLNFLKRKENLQGAFKADKSAKGKRILLVDDVMTTGATLDCAATALKKAGATEVFGLTAASVEYKTL